VQCEGQLGLELQFLFKFETRRTKHGTFLSGPFFIVDERVRSLASYFILCRKGMQMWKANHASYIRSLDHDGCEIISQQNQNGETPVING
jgi:hypothetical protein